ncbi:MAG: trypsin-like peptidase domain-containing protein [Bacteroidales bacterium]|jgi:Do/DeqQ family serine protease|nr:trypsin-like peptidase domain-containing protein [Bacteroidales bacterium]
MTKKTFFSALIITLISVSASLASVAIFTHANGQIPPIEDLKTLTPTVRPLPSGNVPNFVDAAEYSVNTVVHVKSDFLVKTGFYDDYFGFFGRPSTQVVQGFGSGVVISADGYIVTNNHVVQNAAKVEITLNNRKVYPAEVIGTDPSSDLALLKIEAKNLEFLTFGNSDLVHIGEWVLAVGNPFNLTSTVTAGIVSAKARNIHILSQKMSGGERPIESFIQTDAAVNSGNSGGALVNLHGELIGINTAIASNNGSFSGYSFAIPANIAKKVSEDLRTFGHVQRAYLGIAFAPMDQNIASANHLDDVEGIYIGHVLKQSAADKAGLRVEDILLKIDTKSVNTEAELLEILGQHRPGDTVELTFLRNGQTSSVKAILQDIDGGFVKKDIKNW